MLDRVAVCGCGTELAVGGGREEAVCYLCGVRVFDEPGDERDQSSRPLPRVERTTPVRAVKMARLLVAPNRHDVELMSMGVDRLVRPEDEAVCLARAGEDPDSGHVVPDPDCTCGFWAYLPEQSGCHEDLSGVRLDVELAGRVIECERGYRAERQRVLGAWLPGRCAYFLCPRPARWWCFEPSENSGPFCQDHLVPSRFVASTSQLTACTGIEFRWR